MNAFENGKLNIKSILLIVTSVIFCAVVCVFLFCLNITNAVALEQEIRCGIEEHTHTDSCYNGDFLVCEKTAHTHDGNCYIVLLKDNNINGILTLLGNSEARSLEYVITDTMSSALTFNTNLNASQPTDAVTLTLSQDTVAALNTTISDEEDIPDIVLNEGITTLQNLSTEDTTQQSVQQTPQQLPQQIPEQLQQQGNTVSPLAIGDNPVTNQMIGNVYIRLDDSWRCIGTVPITRTGSGSNRSVHVATQALLQTVNDALGSDYTYQSFDIASSIYSGNSYKRYVLNETQTTIATDQSNSNSQKARYIRLIKKGATNANDTRFAFYTVKLNKIDGTVDTQVVESGSTVTLPEGRFLWVSGTNSYDAGETITITDTTTLTAVPLYTVTYKYLDGSTKQETVTEGTEITLPTGNYEWKIEETIYPGGAKITITADTTLIAVPPYIRINYNVGFPTVNGVTVTTKPTIAGLTLTTVTDGYAEGASATIRNVSQQSVEGKVSNNSTGLSRVIQFKGWRIQNTDIILQPNTTLIWDELMQYATTSNINLVAIWEYNALQTASFFIRFDSVAVDTNGNITGQDSNKYTKEIFSAYVGGVNTGLSPTTLTERYGIADETEDNSFTADQQIRALYGERADEVWLSALPSDDFVFANLVQYANTGYLSVDGVAVKAEDLNNKEYAIRWYVFKAQDDAWHIDGKLVKKEGLIHVYKTFAGNKELITEAKTDFYIDATDVSTGVNTVLNLGNYTTYDSATDTYMWEITNVDYGEYWEITEHPHQFDDSSVNFSVYSEYTVMDAHGDQSITGTGTSLTVSGMTYALDEGVDEVLRAEFTNIYNRSDSIIIKKQDSLTGVSIGGAVFQLSQNGQALKFTYNAETHRYQYEPENGNIVNLEGNENGYYEICIDNFSYDLGPITIKEITAPTGYTPIGNIEIGYTDEGKTVGILSGNSELIKYMSGVLIVGNSTDSSSVTAKKNWDCPESEWQDVTVQLLANNKLVTTVIAGVQPQVILSADNNWQHTWKNLPVYVNGEKIVWSIKEVQVGSEAAKADGSFVNWLVSYELPVKSTDEDGNENTLLTVTNTTKRVMLRLTKTNLDKNLQLKGATFLLEAVDKNGNLLPQEIAKTATTGDSGTLIFDNLKSAVRYRLTEVTAPEGYIKCDEYIYFTIGEDGSVTVEETYYAEAGSTAYNIMVRNISGVPLPESGGIGAGMFYIGGLLLILAAIGIYIDIYLKKRRCRN